MAVICRCGRPSWRNSVVSSSTGSPPPAGADRRSHGNASRIAAHFAEGPIRRIVVGCDRELALHARKRNLDANGDEGAQAEAEPGFALICEALGDALATAEMLLNKAGVALVPGSAFGAPGYARLSFATSMEQLETAIERLRKAL